MKKKGDDKEKENIADNICKGMLIIMCHKINFVKEKKNKVVDTKRTWSQRNRRPKEVNYLSCQYYKNSGKMIREWELEMISEVV